MRGERQAGPATEGLGGSVQDFGIYTEHDLHFSVEERDEGAGGVRMWFAFSTNLSGC